MCGKAEFIVETLLTDGDDVLFGAPRRPFFHHFTKSFNYRKASTTLSVGPDGVLPLSQGTPSIFLSIANTKIIHIVLLYELRPGPTRINRKRGYGPPDSGFEKHMHPATHFSSTQLRVYTRFLVYCATWPRRVDSQHRDAA